MACLLRHSSKLAFTIEKDLWLIGPQQLGTPPIVQSATDELPTNKPSSLSGMQPKLQRSMSPSVQASSQTSFDSPMPLQTKPPSIMQRSTAHAIQPSLSASLETPAPTKDTWSANLQPHKAHPDHLSTWETTAVGFPGQQTTTTPAQKVATDESITQWLRGKKPFEHHKRTVFNWMRSQGVTIRTSIVYLRDNKTKYEDSKRAVLNWLRSEGITIRQAPRSSSAE